MYLSKSEKVNFWWDIFQILSKKISTVYVYTVWTYPIAAIKQHDQGNLEKKGLIWS